MLFVLLALVAFQPPPDTLPLLTLDALIGSWRFEWNVPDSPLGAGGKIEGTERYTRLTAPPPAVRGFPSLPPDAWPPDGSNRVVYESVTDAAGPDGPIRARALLVLDPATKTVTRVESDSRGFRMKKTGSIGADLGGYTSIFWESAPATIKGRTIRLTARTIIYSPVSMRVENRLSVDAGAPIDFGRPWYKKVGAP